MLSLPPGSEILDLCCGHGRCAIPLATRGYRVTDQDLSTFLLKKADLAIDAIYGALDGRELTLDAPRLVLLAGKQSAPSS